MSPDKIITKTKEVSETKKKSTQEWPKVAIIILNWNGWKDTIECLESVFRNTYPNYQVIVVDNGSTDGSMEKIKKWAEGRQEILTPKPNHPLYYLSHPPVKKPLLYICYTHREAEEGGNIELEEKTIKEWQKIREANDKFNSTSSYPLIFIQTGENLGYAGGNNVGIRYTFKKDDFEYIWLLNNDTIIESSSLINLFSIVKRNKNIGIIGSKIYYYDCVNRLYSAGFDVYSHWLRGFVISSRGRGEIDQGQFDKVTEVDFISGCSLFIKLNTIKEIGFLNESYFLYFEDVDWNLRAKGNGWLIFYAPISKIWHKSEASTKLSNGISTKLYYYSIRNKLLFCRNFFQNKFRFWLFFFPLYFVYTIILIGKFFIIKDIEKAKMLLKAQIDFLKEFRKI